MVRFDKKNRKITVECWPRFADVDEGAQAQFAGWPITFDYRNNDGRKPSGFLPEMVVKGVERPVVQVIEDATGEILYTVRMNSNRFRAPVYSDGNFTVKMGREKPDLSEISGLKPVQAGSNATLQVDLN